MSENQALFEWSRLNKDIHEDLAASKTYEALLTTFPANLEGYLSWFTAGVGATIALLLSNVDKIVPYLGREAYTWAIAAFGISVGAGAIGKLMATYVVGMMAMSKQISTDIAEALTKYYSEASKIQDLAKTQKIDIDIELEISSLMRKLASQMSCLQKLALYFTMKRMERADNKVLYRYRLPMRLIDVQSFCFLIALFSAGSGVYFVASAVAHKAFVHEAPANPAAAQPETTLKR